MTEEQQQILDRYSKIEEEAGKIAALKVRIFNLELTIVRHRGRNSESFDRSDKSIQEDLQGLYTDLIILTKRLEDL